MKAAAVALTCFGVLVAYIGQRSAKESARSCRPVTALVETGLFLGGCVIAMLGLQMLAAAEAA